MRSALVVQMRVIAALMLRETRTRFGKSQLGYLWSLVEPIAVVATFTLMFKALENRPPIGDSLPLFFATGMLSFQMYRRIASFCSAAFEANHALLNYPIVKQVDTLVARTALEFLTTVFSMILVFGALIVFWDVPPPSNIGYLVLSMFLLTLIGFGHGTINAVIISRFESWKNIDPLIARPLFFISGIFFVPDVLPPKITHYISWNPLLHGIELTRLGYYSGYRSATLDVGYLFGFALVIAMIGLASERAMRFRPQLND